MFLFPVAGPSEIKSEEPKDERELTEEERKQKIKDELGEDVLKMLEGSESQGEGAVPTIDEPCKKCKGNDKKLCKECGCMKCGGKTPPEQVILQGPCQPFLLMGSQRLIFFSFWTKLMG